MRNDGCTNDLRSAISFFAPRRTKSADFYEARRPFARTFSRAIYIYTIRLIRDAAARVFAAAALDGNSVRLRARGSRGVEIYVCII